MGISESKQDDNEAELKIVDTDNFVIVDISNMGDLGPLQEALISSGAFEGRNPGEAHWSKLIKNRVFKAERGCEYTADTYGDACIVTVIANVVPPSSEAS